MRKFLFLIMVAVALLLGAKPGLSADLIAQNDLQLDATIQQFMQYQMQQDYKGVWRLLSQRTKDGNKNDQIEYERYFRSGGFYYGEFALKKIVKTERAALVTVEAGYFDSSSRKKLGTELEEWKFVSENGGWFFDDYKSLSESPQ